MDLNGYKWILVDNFVFVWRKLEVKVGGFEDEICESLWVIWFFTIDNFF